VCRREIFRDDEKEEEVEEKGTKISLKYGLRP
jgi:hypothetical protein